MGTQLGQVGDEKFSNWVKDTLALLYTKECLEVIADERSAVFHGQLKTAVGNTSTCTCSWEALNQDRKHQKWVVKNCPGVCQKWLDLIISHHSNGPLPKLAPRNTDPSLWPSDTWEVMKVYQSYGCQGHHSARDADVAALIDLMRNCNHFAPLITNPSLINQVITVRNKLMHSKDFKVENQELSQDLQSMLSFLRSLTTVTGASSLSATEHQAVQAAITEVDKLRTSILDMTLNRELQLKALKAKQVALETDMKVLEQTINDARADTAAVKSGLTGVEDKLSTEVQTLQQRLVSQLSMIQDVKKDMTEQQQSTATVVSNLACLQQQFDDLKLDHDETKNNIIALKQRMSDLEITNQEQASTITTLYQRQQTTETELQHQQQESQAHASQLEHHQNKLDTHTSKLDQLGEHQGEIDTHTIMLQDHETQLQGHQSHIESQNRTLDSHETQLQGHQSHIKSQNRILDSHRTQLQGHQSHIESQNRTLECHGAKLDRLENKQMAQQTDGAMDIKGLQRQLISMYKAWIEHFPLYLLMSERKICLEDIYVEQCLKVVDPDGRMKTESTISKRRQATYTFKEKSSMSDSEYVGSSKSDSENENQSNSGQFISSLEDVFYSESNKCQHIYVSGNAGYGKSIFCSHLVRLWCKAHSQNTTELTPDEEVMAEFPLLFYVDLRDAKFDGTDENADEMCSLIRKQLRKSGIRLSYDQLSQLLQAGGGVLVVMDALDECKEERLPRGGICNNCTTLVTSRPWKLEALRCDPENRVDNELEIVGLKKGSPEDLSEKLVKLLNKKWNKNKDSKDFIRKMEEEGLQEFLDIPMMLTSMLCLYFDDIPFGQSQVEVYRNSIHHQILAAVKNKDVPEYSCPSEAPFPICQRDKCPCKCYGELLWKVSELACRALLGNVRERALVMDHAQTEFLGLSDEDVAICMKLGILTQYKLLGNVTDYEPQKSVSFTHKTYQEWFAAIYLSFKLPVSELNTLLSEAIADLDSALALDQMFLFVCGLNSEVATKLSEFIMLRVSLDSNVQEYLRSNYTSHAQLIRASLSEQKMSNVSSDVGYCRSEGTKFDEMKSDILSLGGLSDFQLIQTSSDARVKTYRRSHYTSHDQLIRTIQNVVVAGAVEAKKNNKERTALQLHNVTIGWYLYMGFSNEDILTCDTSHAKSVFIEDVDIGESGGEKRKITPWPASSCLEKLHLRNITNAFDDTFCDNFSAAQLVHLYLDNVTMTRPQLESLCRSLASAGSLKIVVVYKLACITRKFRSMMLDLSQHQRLEHLTLQSHPIDRKWGVSLCQEMDKLRKVKLGNITLTHDGLESLYWSLASAGSLMEVVISKLTCITHRDNTHNCYINLDISQYVSLKKLFYIGLPRRNIKITSWPSSSRMQAVDLHHVEIVSCDGLNVDNVSNMYLDDVKLTHDQLEILCGSLASARSLRTVDIRELTCKTHQDNRQECGIILNFSQHQGLEELRLLDLGVGEVQGVSLCQNMERVELSNITLTHRGLEILCGSLASARSLRTVNIRKLTCITHQGNRHDCSIMLNLSQQQGLTKLRLLDLGVGEVQEVSLCQNMERVELSNITLTHRGLESLCGSLAMAVSLRTVDIREFTCKTHQDNRQNCCIQLDFSQYIGTKSISFETINWFVKKLQNVKITSWPSSSCMETVDLRSVDISSCDTFCNNFIINRVSNMYLEDVKLTHDQLESLCGSLASARSLRTVNIRELTCITHQGNRHDCSIRLNISQHQGLKELRLLDLGVCEVQGVSLCQNMEKVELCYITLTHGGLESMCGSLATAVSLRTVDIRELTCKTHQDNRQNCCIQLDFSQYIGTKSISFEKINRFVRKLQNVKITSWPSSSCMETVDLRSVDISSCDTFCNNFIINRVSNMYLEDVKLTHDQLESLCGSLVTAGSLRTVDIRELTCITHQDNRQDCCIQLDFSQYLGTTSISFEKIQQSRLQLQFPNFKITSWPSSSCMETVDLRCVDMSPCDTFCDIFIIDTVSKMYLENVILAHDQLESLCGRLALARSLRTVDIRELTCKTHKDNRHDCSIMLNLSRHQGLKELRLLDLGVGEVQGVSLCQNMEKVELRNITLTHGGLESLCGSLVTTGSLRRVYIRELTCITHQDNRQDCCIQLDFSQYLGTTSISFEKIQQSRLQLQFPNFKITSWPSSSCMETVDLRSVDISSCDTFCNNFIINRVSNMYLEYVKLTHDQLESLCGSLVTAGSLRTVDIRELTCITHQDNRQDCCIQLDFSQYLGTPSISFEKIQQSRLQLQFPNFKITSWPSSSCMETVDLRCVDMSPCDTFCDNFIIDTVSKMYLENVILAHDQLESLCGRLALARSLRTVDIRALTCKTHQDNRHDCSIMLNLSQHRGLKELRLLDLGVGEVQGVSLCQNMEKVELSNITLTHGGLEILCGSLATAVSLRRVYIRELTCITHQGNRQECGIILNFSQHHGLEDLTLWKLGVGELQGVRLCQNMNKLRCVELGGCISAAALRQTLEALPVHCGRVRLGGWGAPLRVRGVEEARQLLGEIRRTPQTIIFYGDVEYTGDECVVNHFWFYKK